MLLKASTILLGLVLLAGVALYAVKGAAGFDFLVGQPMPRPALPTPAQAGGVTVLAKQPAEGPPRMSAPRTSSIATPAGEATGEARSTAHGFAVELGKARSFAELSARFAAISRDNAEAGFDRLEPRATLVDTFDGLEARLLVGPFATKAEAQATCGQIALPAGIVCRAVPFAGERIARR